MDVTSTSALMLIAILAVSKAAADTDVVGYLRFCIEAMISYQVGSDCRRYALADARGFRLVVCGQ